MNSVPEETGLLARALLRSPGLSVPLLPEGEARIEKIGQREVAANGEKRTIIQYSISGLDFLPVPVWLNEDRTYFATVTSWYSATPQGWESVIPELLKAQEDYASQRTSEIANKLAHRPGSRIVIQNADLFDSQNATTIPDQTVIISGNRIETVGPASSVKIPAGAEVIDGRGKTLVPGLWDMHVHLTDVDPLLHLAAGVTTVRDLANDIDKVTTLRKQITEGTAIGPRMILAGFMDGPGPYAGPSKVLVDNQEEARSAIERYAQLGYEQIKIYSSLKPELVPFIIEEAHRRGLRVSGHIPAFMTAAEVVRLGLDEIQHANFLFLNFLAEKAKDTRTPLRFTAVAENAALLDLHSEQVQSFLQLLKDRGVVLDPTLNAFETLFTDRPGTMASGIAAVAGRLPLQIRRAGLTGGLPVPEGMDQRYRDSFRAMQNMIKAAFDAGITIVAGTDSLAGFGLDRELELYVQAGIPAEKVLQMATFTPAKVMKRDKELGSIAAGKLADLILTDGSPVADISNIRKVSTVIKDGVIYLPAELYKAIGVNP